VIFVGLLLAFAFIVLVNVLGGGPNYGQTEQLYTVTTAAGVETEMIATNSETRAKDRWLQGFTMHGTTALRYIRVDGPPATFQGESWHFLGKRNHNEQHVVIDLPVQVFMPFDEDLNIFAFTDGIEVVEVNAIWTYQKRPDKPQGFFYSQLINETIAGSNLKEDLPTLKTVAMALGRQKLMGTQIAGESQSVARMNLRSTLWGTVQEDEFEGDDGPWTPGSDTNIESDGIFMPLGDWWLADSRNYIPSVIGAAGDIWAVVYWRTENVPPQAVASA